MSTTPDQTGRHRRFIPSARTNLPVWPDAPPSVDGVGRSFILAGIGPMGAAIVGDWRRQVEALGRPALVRSCDEGTAAAAGDWLEAALGAARVGCRLMLAGPASDVLLLIALARQAGLLEAEIRSFAVKDSRIRCQCVHCKSEFRCEGAPGSVVSCPGCGRALLVHQHFSRRSATHVAFVADIEKSR